MWGIPYIFLCCFIAKVAVAVSYFNDLQNFRNVETYKFESFLQIQDEERKENLKNNNVFEYSQSDIVANIIRRSINKSVNPCENFYNYACGSWERNYPLPNDQNVWDLDKISEQNINIKLRDILEEEIKPDDVIPLQYEKLWYRSCTNLAQLEEDGIKPLEDTLNHAGGWPITMNSYESNNDSSWQQVHKYYMDFNEVNALFDIVVSNDVRNTSKFIIMLDQPADTLYDSMLNDENVEYSLNKYENFMKKIALIFAKSAGRNVSVEDVVKDVKSVLDFEKKLNSIKSEANIREEFEWSQNYMKIKDLQEFYDQENHERNTSKINWLETIADAFKEINVTIADSEEIQVIDKVYLHKLSNLLDKIPNRIIVTYIHWKFLIYSLEYTTREMIDLAVEVALEHRGFKKEPERWLTCLTDLKPRYGIMFKYINKYFPEDSKKMGSEMAIKVRDKMIDQMQQSSWLDEPTKKKTINKLRKLSINIGYAKVLSNATFLAHVYDQFKIGKTYCESAQNYRKYEIKRNLQLLRTYDEKNNADDILMDPLRANALYQQHTNSLIITAAQLSIPFFGASIPMSINYGYVGSIIGHEISHAMDNEGRLYNEHGNVESWWPQNMIQEYKRKSQCFINQFNNYSLDGKLTLNENMADTIGVQLAYDAFKTSSSMFGFEDTKLSSLEELSSDQLFFLSFALSYCQSTAPQFWLQHSNDAHSPNRYRIIGTVTNLESFARAFQCPTNSSMNPASKCYLW